MVDVIEHFELVEPRFVPPLDVGFRPAVLANECFIRNVQKSKFREPLVIALERPDGSISRFETIGYAQKSDRFEENLFYTERLIKFLLWARGGWRVFVGGPPFVGEYIRKVYRTGQKRAFDAEFMGEEVYEKDFEVVVCDVDEVPSSNESSKKIGRNLKGCRIGFDLGASDRKVSAVIDGEAVFSEEVVWEPKKHGDPNYHYEEVMKGLRAAASRMPRVDAIGGSSAGVWVDNRPMVASLFRGIPKEKYHLVRDMFIRIGKELGVPLEVANDGDVTALAGSMSFEDNAVLGIALGSSEAAGYVNREGNIVGWLNELAFAPIDYSPQAPVDEWSGDRGCGASYFSQQCVFRLAPKAGISIPGHLTDADKLKLVQEKLESGHEGAIQVWRSMGTYMGYGIAHYADFYDLKHVLILGRCTSGRGGQIIIDRASEVLRAEFPDLISRIELHLPDEKFRRVGQSIAAASLPMLG